MTLAVTLTVEELRALAPWVHEASANLLALLAGVRP